MIDEGCAQDWLRHGNRMAARRAAIRRHHPDAGGTAIALTGAFEAIDLAYRPAVRDLDTVFFVSHHGISDRAKALAKVASRRIMARLSSFPGSVPRRRQSIRRGARRAPITSSKGLT